MSRSSRHPKLILATVLLFIIAIVAVLMMNPKNPLPLATRRDVQGQPTIGYPKASVHVIAFEEPKCSNCREYSLRVFPEIRKQYIDQHKVLYTSITVSFLPGSMPLAEALLCIYLQTPAYPDASLYFDFQEYLYAHEPPESTAWEQTGLVYTLAKESSPDIDVDQLRKCVEKRSMISHVEANNAYLRYLLNGTLQSPVVFVDGVLVKDASKEGVMKAIDKALAKKEERK